MRWYLQRGAPPKFTGIVLVVEREDERGYCCEVSCRHEARACLPWLVDMVKRIDTHPAEVQRYSAVEVVPALALPKPGDADVADLYVTRIPIHRRGT